MGFGKTDKAPTSVNIQDRWSGAANVLTRPGIKIRNNPRAGNISCSLNDDELGILLYTVKGNNLHIDDMESFHKRQGVGKALIAYVLLQNPRVDQISAELSSKSTNMIEYKRILESTRDHEAAIRGTPMYSINVSLGFTKKIKHKYTGSTVHVTMSRK